MTQVKMPDVKISPAGIVIGLAMILIVGAFGWLTFAPKPSIWAPLLGYTSSVLLPRFSIRCSTSTVFWASTPAPEATDVTTAWTLFNTVAVP